MPCPHCGEKINICTFCAYNQSEEFIRCPKCNKIVDYCAYCGKPLDINLPSDNKVLYDTLKILRDEIGTERHICPSCGQIIDDNMPFCPFCGCELTEEKLFSEAINADNHEIEQENNQEKRITILEPKERQRQDFLKTNKNDLKKNNSGITLLICLILLGIAIYLIFNSLYRM